MSTGKTITFYIPDGYVNAVEEFKKKHKKGAGKKIGAFCKAESHEDIGGMNYLALEEAQSALDAIEAVKQNLTSRIEAMQTAKIQPIQNVLNENGSESAQPIQVFRLAFTWLKRAMTRMGDNNFEKPYEYFCQCPQDVHHYATMAGMDDQEFRESFRDWLETEKILFPPQILEPKPL